MINQSLEEIVVEKLMKKGWHISFAESCTAGLAAARLVDVPSASGVFDASLVTYANEAKIHYLGVSLETIKSFGVVSEEVALEMAIGVSKVNSAEVGVGISGIAGPAGGSDLKPVGMVCFGFKIGEVSFSKTCLFGNLGRRKVREAAVEFVFKTLAERI